MTLSQFSDKNNFNGLREVEKKPYLLRILSCDYSWNKLTLGENLYSVYCLCAPGFSSYAQAILDTRLDGTEKGKRVWLLIYSKQKKAVGFGFIFLTSGLIK